MDGWYFSIVIIVIVVEVYRVLDDFWSKGGEIVGIIFVSLNRVPT